MKNRAYIPAISFLATGLALHVIGILSHVYTAITWYDDPVHFISGLGLGFAFYWMLTEFWTGLPGRNIWAVVALTFIAAIVWECFEAYFDLAGYPVGSVAYCVDTTKDIINGVIGSIVALIAVRETYDKKHKS